MGLNINCQRKTKIKRNHEFGRYRETCWHFQQALPRLKNVLGIWKGKTLWWEKRDLLKIYSTSQEIISFFSVLRNGHGGKKKRERALWHWAFRPLSLSRRRCLWWLTRAVTTKEAWRTLKHTFEVSGKEQKKSSDFIDTHWKPYFFCLDRVSCTVWI